MAEKKTTFVLEASDRTKKVFDDVARNAGTVDAAVKRIGGSLTGIALGGGIVGIGLGLAVLTGQSIDAMDAMDELAQRTNVSVELLSALDLIAKQSGTDLETVGGAVQKLTKNLNEYVRDGGSKVADSFRAIGISREEALQGLQDMDAFLPTFAKKLLENAEGGQKVAAAQELMSKTGANLLPFMQQLAEAGRLNAKYTTEQAAAAGRFNDQMARLKDESSKLGVALANTLLPSLNKIADAMVRGQKEGGILAGIFEGMKESFAEVFQLNIEGDLNKVSKKIVESYDKLRDLENSAAGGSRILSTGRVQAEIAKERANIQSLITERDRLERTVRSINDLKAPAQPASGGGKPPIDEAGLKKMEALIEKARDQMRRLEDEARKAGGIDRSKLDEINELLSGKDWEKLPASMKEQLRILAARVDGEKEIMRLLRQEAETQEDFAKTSAEAWSFVADMQKKLKGREFFENMLGEENIVGVATEDIDAMTKAGLEAIDAMQEILDMQARLYAGFDENGNALEKQIDEITEFFRSAAEQSQQAFADLFFSVMEGNIQRMDRQFASFINRLVANALAAKAATALFGSDFGKGGEIGGIVGQGLDYIKTIFGGGRAGGGPVSRGRAYLVGEDGPEIIVPRQAGYVVPNSALGGRGLTIGSINIAVPAQPGRSFGDTGRQVADALMSRLARV